MTRTTGKITHWNVDKGYGFITPSTGAKQVFVHISAFGRRVQQPEINMLVSFVLAKGKDGRPCAERVALAGAASPDRFKRNDRNLYIWAALAFLVLLAAVCLGGTLPLPVLYVYLAMSVLACLMYWMDKSAAQNDHSRTPEKSLHFVALLGGWPGAMIAQQVLRHKSSKPEFRVKFWITVALNSAVLGWLFTPYGKGLLNSILV